MFVVEAVLTMFVIWFKPMWLFSLGNISKAKCSLLCQRSCRERSLFSLLWNLVQCTLEFQSSDLMHYFTRRRKYWIY